MKLLPLLALSYCSIVVVLSESTESAKSTKEQDLKVRASKQLERLAPYRRVHDNKQPISDEQWQLLENAAKDPEIRAFNEEKILEIYWLLPENVQKDIIEKIGGSREIIEMLANKKYMALVEDKDINKRSGSKRETYSHDGYETPTSGYPPQEYAEYAPEYGDQYGKPESSGSDSGSILKGSGSLIGGIAKGIIGGLVSASGSASKGSSSVSASSSQSSVQSSSNSGDKPKPRPEYGQVYSYGEKVFDVWDFKKAIVSTLMQAVKAISGGVIALKGQLLKGSGYLVSSKGKIISKTGDVITTLGRNIAKSAVQPRTESPPPMYLYDHPPPPISHEDIYEGPPPPDHEEYSGHHGYHENANYESSDIEDQAGLLIAKPTKPDNHDHHTVNLEIRKPAVTHPEDDYYGPPPELPHKDIENTVIPNYHFNQDDHKVNSNSPLPSSYDVMIQHSSNDQNGYDYPIYPPLAPSPPSNLHAPYTIQQSIEYPPIHIQYSIPDKGNLHFPKSDISSNDLSVYSSLSIDTNPKIESIKISAELPKLQSLANISKSPLLPYSYSMLQGPLKIPLLTPYWQNQGLIQPFTNFNMHGLYQRKSSGQRRRSINEFVHRMRLPRG